MRRWLLTAMLALAPGVAAADPAALATHLAKDFTTPRFAAVASAAAAQQKAWAAYCPNRTPAGVDALRKAFAGVADAWAQVDFMRSGPETAHMRAERMNYWIDRTDLSGKALNAMLTAPDETGLADKALAGTSAAGQGLPVLERLLYPDGAARALAAAGPEGERRCAVGAAVARNVAGMSADIASDWGGADGAVAAIAANGRWGVSFGDAREAASVMLTDLTIGVEALKDNEVALLFHDEANAAAPQLAEQWRSSRALQDIRLKYAGLRQGLEPFTSLAAGPQKAQLDASFAAVDARLAEVARTQAQAPPHSPERVEALKQAMAALGDLQMSVMTIAPVASGVALGFNSLDGD